MTGRVLPLVAVAVAAIGCSVLVNTDFTGGTEPAASNKGGRGGDTVLETGGTLFGSGGTTGGTLNEGGDADATSDAGSDTGPDTGGTGGTAGNNASGGTGGDTAGSPDGDAGETSGGTGGETMTGGLGGSAGTSGAAGRGGTNAGGVAGTGNGGATGGVAGTSNGGMSGSSAGGCNADLMTDPMHCGSCDKACASGVDCEDGLCITTPCVGLCTMPDAITKKSDGYREDNISADEACFETTMYDVTPPALPSFICWNIKDRTVQVNGVTLANGTTVQCQGDPGAAVPALRAGGYCVHVTASKSGDTTDGFKFPSPGELMPTQ
ncbi:MAG TPA: hypothetical protein VMI54_19830 [Polyangiaceae bacterium]|nr:hypothetical protein [Polyangiaceae bacterium]